MQLHESIITSNDDNILQNPSNNDMLRMTRICPVYFPGIKEVYRDFGDYQKNPNNQ